MKKLLKFILFPVSLILWVNWWITAMWSISLLIIISFIVPKRAYNSLVRIVCRILMYCILIFPRHKGLKPEDVRFPVIFTANHISFFDLFVSGSVLPGYPRGLELAEHFKTPIYGWFISRFGQIPIDSSSKASIKKSFKHAIEILSNNIRNLFVMPEGSRTRTGELGKFKLGAFYLSRKSGIPIVPVVYKGLYNRNNRNSILIIPGFFDVYILPPVFPDDFKTDEEMAGYIKNVMKRKLKCC